MTLTLVCFAASFRLDGSRGAEETPNISHALRVDGTRTLCGRVGWITTEGDTGDGIEPDCLVCSRVGGWNNGRAA